MTQKSSKPVQIGTLAKQLGITTRTIRYYEEIGLMGKTERADGGTRTYNDDDILRLKFILKLKGLGISLKEIHELSDIFDINEQDVVQIVCHKVQGLLSGFRPVHRCAFLFQPGRKGLSDDQLVIHHHESVLMSHDYVDAS